MVGSEIGEVCEEVCRLARELNETIRFDFNGVFISATPTSVPLELRQLWEREMDKRAKAYAESHEGKRAEEKRKQRTINNQRIVDTLLKTLPEIIRHREQLVDWLVAFCQPADDMDVKKYDPVRLAEKIEIAGWIENIHVGRKPEEFNRRMMGEYIIGQAINCLKKGLPPHSITKRFADQMKGME